MRTTIAPSLAEQAAEAARAAADRAGVEIRPIEDADGAQTTARLISEVWEVDASRPPVAPEMIRSLAVSHNYAVAAFKDGEQIGTALGMLGLYGPGLHLHSYLAGVRERYRSSSIGFAMKQHQRAWALERDIPVVAWTFDPLVRRNAFFNLIKLGAEASQYHPDFYGPMADGLNAGDLSDRILIEWRLDTPRAIAASRGEREVVELASLEAEGAVRLLRMDDAGEPVIEDGDGGRVLLCQVPEDIVALRGSSPESGRRWRVALRETLGSALGDGYRANGITRDGWYVLRRA
jgi:predicted GNAT superfamily acetyltransferase